MTNEDKVKLVYPDAWFRIAGPRSAQIKILGSTVDLAAMFSHDRRKLWKQAWLNVPENMKAEKGLV